MDNTIENHKVIKECGLTKDLKLSWSECDVNCERVSEIAVNGKSYIRLEHRKYWDSGGYNTNQYCENEAAPKLYNYLSTVWSKRTPEKLPDSPLYISFYCKDVIMVIRYLSESSSYSLNNKRAAEYHNLLLTSKDITQPQADNPFNHFRGSLSEEAANIFKNFKGDLFTTTITNKNCDDIAQIALAANDNSISSKTLIKDIDIKNATLNNTNERFLKLPLKYTNYIKYLKGVTVGDLHKLIEQLPEKANLTNSLELSKKILNGDFKEAKKYGKGEWLLIGGELYSSMLKDMYSRGYSNSSILIEWNELIFKNERTFNRPNMLKLLTHYYKNAVDENDDKRSLVFNALLGFKTNTWFNGSITKANYIIGELVEKVGEDKALEFVYQISKNNASISETKWLKIINDFDQYSVMPVDWLKEIL